MNIFYPDIYAKNIFEIDYEKLKSKGIKCLVFDLDNTLVPVKSSVADEKVKALFTTLKKQKFTIILMSNSLKKRVEVFKKDLKVPCFSFSMKPLIRAIYIKQIIGII